MKTLVIASLMVVSSGTAYLTTEAISKARQKLNVKRLNKALHAPQETATSDSCASPGNPGAFVWRVTRPGRRPLLLFGTGHAWGPEKIPRTVSSAITKDTTVCTEVDAFAEQSREINELVYLPEGHYLDDKDQIGEENYQKLVKLLPDQPRLRKMTPGAALGALQEQVVRSSEDPMDGWLQAEAKRKRARYVPLASIKKHYEISKFVAPSALELIATMATLDRERARLLADSKAYLEGNAAALEASECPDGVHANDPKTQALVPQRNKDWQKTLTGECDIAGVGAVHLLCKDGVPALLQKAGYKVDRIGQCPVYVTTSLEQK